MKKMYYTLIAIVVIFFVAYLITTQYLQKDYIDYFQWKNNNQLIYLVKRDSVLKQDTLKLIMVKGKQKNYKNICILSSYDTSNQKYLSDTIIVKTSTDIDNNRYLSWNHPTIKYFSITQYLPSINIPLPLEQGYYKEFKQKITSIDFENEADTSVSSFSGHITISGKTFFQTPLFQDSCWIIEGKYDKLNSNFTTYFNKKYGFVYFIYKYNNSSIELELLSIE